MSRVITREQYIKACTAFWEAIGGGDATEVYFPVLLQEDRITFPRVPAVNGGHVRANAVGFDAEPAEVLSIVTTVEVQR